jgi:hypothetical protein
MNGLPDFSTMRISRSGVEKHAVIIGEFDVDNDPLPYPYQEKNKNDLFTLEDMEHYKIKNVIRKTTWTWTKEISLLPYFEKIMNHFPLKIQKKIFRSYWGWWISPENLINKMIINGKIEKTWELPNISYNPLYAHIIVSRVRHRLYAFSNEAKRIFVDSILTPIQHPEIVGEKIGDFKFVGEFKDVFVRNPGLVYSRDGKLDKHSGIRRIA